MQFLVLRKVRQLRRLAFSSTLLFIGLLVLTFSLIDVSVKAGQSGRVLGFLLLVAGTAWLLLHWLRSMLRERASYIETARRVERRVDGMDSVLHTATEFSIDRTRTERLSSRELVEAVIEDADRRTADVPVERYVKRRYTPLLHLAAMCTMLTIGSLAVVFPRIFVTTARRLFLPWAKLPPPTLVVLNVKPGNAECSQYSTFAITAEVTPESYKVPDKVLLEYAITKPKAGENTSKWVTEKMLPAKEDQFSYTFKRVDESFKYRVRAGDYTSPVYVAGVFIPPKVKSISMRLVYPGYTHTAEQELKDCLGPVTAIKGTTVFLTIQANTPLGSCRIEFDKAQPVDATVRDNEALASFAVTDNDNYRIIISDNSTHSNADQAVSYAIHATDDEAPKVRLVEPGINLNLTKTAEVPMRIEAEDDFGLREVGVAYKVKTDYEQRVALKQFADIVKNLRTAHTMMLEDRYLADTDIVTYYAYAIDNNVVTGPTESVSKLYFIEIRPYGQRYREAPSMPGGGSAQQQEKKNEGVVAKLEEIIEKQKGILTDTFSVDRVSRSTLKYTEKQQMQLAALETRQNDLRQRLQVLARNLAQRLIQFRLHEHLDRLESMWSALNQMHIAVVSLGAFDTRGACNYENEALYHLYRAKRDIEHLLSKAGDAETKRKLQQAFEQSMQDYRQDMQRQLDQENDQLKQHAKKLEELRRQQNELNQQLQEHTKDNLKAQRNEPSAPSQAQRQNSMDKSAQRQAELADKTLEEYAGMKETESLNPRVGPSQLREMARAYHEMTQTRESLTKHKPEEARDHGLKAEKRLSDALKRVQEAMQRSLGEQLKSVAQRAQDLARKQQEMARNGSPPPGANDAKQQQTEQKENWKDLAEKVKKSAEKLQNADSELGRKMAEAAKKMDSPKLDEAMKKAEESLAKGQPREARKPQAEAAQQMEQAAKELDKVAKEFSMDESSRLADAFNRAQKLTQQQKSLTDKMAKQPSRPQANAQMKAQQEQIAQGTEDLARKVDRLSAVQETDLKKSLQSSLQNAKSAMQKSAESMGKDPKEAKKQANTAQGEMRRVNEALKRLLNQSLNQELAELAESSRQAEAAQKSARKMTDKLVEQERANSDKLVPPPSNVENQVAVQQQQEAKKLTEQLENKMQELVKRSETADKELASRVKDAMDKLKPAETKKAMQDATYQLGALNPSAAAPHQDRALEKLKSSRQRIEDTQKDRTPLLAQKLKNLQEETEKLSAEARSQAKQLAEQKGEPRRAGRGETGEKLKELVDRTEALKKRLEYLDRKEPGEAKQAEPNPSEVPADWKQLLDTARKQIESSRDSYAKGATEKATTGLKQASRGFQVLSEGIIGKLERLSSRQKRSAPGLERVPTRYRKLVDEYYRALSEEK